MVAILHIFATYQLATKGSKLNCSVHRDDDGTTFFQDAMEFLLMQLGICIFHFDEEQGK